MQPVAALQDSLALAWALRTKLAAQQQVWDLAVLRVLAAHHRGGALPASEAQWRVLLRWAAADAGRTEARWRRGAPSDDPAESSLAPPAARPERALERREFATDLVRALQVLPMRQREVFVLRALYEWPFERIAARLQISPSTARQHALRAKCALQASLRTHGDH